MSALTVGSVLVVALRPRGDLPLLALLLVVLAWTAYVPAPTPWAILAAAGLLVAHACLAVADATRDRASLPRAALGRLARRVVVVLAVTCLAGFATVARYAAQDQTHAVAAVVGCLLLGGWVALLRQAPGASR